MQNKFKTTNSYLCAMVYRVIGLMSGSSLDGLDIVFAQIEEVRGKWGYEIIHAECIPYTDQWAHDLKHAATLQVKDFLVLNTRYGRLLGGLANSFVARYNLEHKVGFIASHGHTVFHEPSLGTTCQIGCGATLSAVTGLPVVCDLRAKDVALGGQGAPIVPIGDKLFFGSYEYLLNLGGIANITIQLGDNHMAYDLCAANQVLNALAGYEGLAMDENGELAAAGHSLINVLDLLDDAPYYKQNPPKSLSNDMAQGLVFPKLLESNHSTPDMLHTMVQHIANQVTVAIRQHPHGKPSAKMLVTGGGAFNTFLVAQISKALASYQVDVEVPSPELVKYKEALVMALIGVLRWRGEANVLASVTGANGDSVGGAFWGV